jgi:two-component system, OmpR family, sensor histidine kinase ArlS
MKLRNKILLYFSVVLIPLVAVSFVVIYVLFNEYREEEFQQRQRQKVLITLNLLAEYKEMGENLTMIMDRLTIHDFYDEKMLIFDADKNEIYSSIDDLEIENYRGLLEQLSSENSWIETYDGEYDVIGLYLQNQKGGFYALSKAYDKFGYTKLHFLRNILLLIFFAFTIVILSSALWISRIISRPLANLALQMDNYKLDQISDPITITTDTSEINNLNNKFFELLSRIRDAYAFQKHITSHISHELKTPVSILVSELERMESLSDMTELKEAISQQKEKTRYLGDIINALLRFSKIDAGQNLYHEKLRVDELLFDIAEEVCSVHTDFSFETIYESTDIVEEYLHIQANRMLLQLAFHNLLNNCVNYADEQCAVIHIDARRDALLVSISNSGPTILPEEQKFLFEYYFRGKNSEGKTGFGLGLVLCKKIFSLFNAKIAYSTPKQAYNQFTITFMPNT